MDKDEIPEPRGRKKIKTGNINVDQGSMVNIAGGDIQQIILPTQAAEARERHSLQVNNLATAAQDYAAAQDRLRQELANPQSPPSPYKGLHYFDPTDQTIFFGRQDIADELVGRILQPQNRLTVLHAPSGAGKTSLIRAGLIPRLLQQGCLFLWTTPLPYPASIYAPLTDVAPPYSDFSDLPLRDFFGLVVGRLRLPTSGKLVLFIDQFERIFSHAGSEILQVIERDMAACLRAEEASLPLRIVIAIRSDFLWALDQLRAGLPSILDHRFLLPTLTSNQALQAIMSPLNNWPVQWQPDAAQAVLAYLTKGEMESPHLQLICSQLYEKAVKLDQAFITCAEVAEHDLADLHYQYLRSELALLVDEELGWALLKRLVDSGGVSRPQLVQDLPGEMQTVIETLVERRVLRQSRTTQGLRVEIAHETLAQEILAHESKQEIRRKAARELISRGLEDWQRHTTLMDSPRLSILDEYRDVIEPLFKEELNLTWKHAALEFLLRSALQYGQSIPFWFTIAQQNGVMGEAIVLEGLQSDAFRARAAAVTALGRLGVQFIPDLCSMLADDYTQVRMAAIAALERLQPSGEWRMHLKYECFVPEGEFIMGNGEVAHKVFLEAFYIGRYPVTKSEYKRYSKDVNQPFDVPEGKERHPVVEVTWYDARNYATWAGMRLLSEAEWEKAASWDLSGRGEKRRYPWGDEFDKTKCNTAKSGIRTTTPVGRFSPYGDSPYGCADMAGNVWEWCSSKFEKYPYQKDDGREEMSGYDLRVRRGGSFDRNASHAACAYRLHLSPLNRTSRDGFRVGADVPTTLDSEDSEH